MKTFAQLPAETRLINDDTGEEWTTYDDEIWRVDGRNKAGEMQLHRRGRGFWNCAAWNDEWIVTQDQSRAAYAAMCAKADELAMQATGGT